MINLVKIQVGNDLFDQDYLCATYKGLIFVSKLYKDEEFGIYVDDIARKTVINVRDLKEIYLIQKN